MRRRVGHSRAVHGVGVVFARPPGAPPSSRSCRRARGTWGLSKRLAQPARRAHHRRPQAEHPSRLMRLWRSAMRPAAMFFTFIWITFAVLFVAVLAAHVCGASFCPPGCDAMDWAVRLTRRTAPKEPAVGCFEYGRSWRCPRVATNATYGLAGQGVGLSATASGHLPAPDSAVSNYAFGEVPLLVMVSDHRARRAAPLADTVPARAGMSALVRKQTSTPRHS